MSGRVVPRVGEWSSDERAGWVLFGVPDHTAVLAHYKRRATYYTFGVRSWECLSVSESCIGKIQKTTIAFANGICHEKRRMVALGDE